MEIVTGRNTPVLRQRAQEVTAFDADLAQLVEDMTQTMLHPDEGEEVQGIGIAANQVGVLKRVMIVTFNVRSRNNPKIVAMINPEILEASKATVKMEEGCLSLPGEYGDVVRPAKLKVAWYNVEGNRCEKKLDGWDARIFLHELDHLDGKLFVDYL